VTNYCWCCYAGSNPVSDSLTIISIHSTLLKIKLFHSFHRFVFRNSTYKKLDEKRVITYILPVTVIFNDVITNISTIMCFGLYFNICMGLLSRRKRYWVLLTLESCATFHILPITSKKPCYLIFPPTKLYRIYRDFSGLRLSSHECSRVRIAAHGGMGRVLVYYTHTSIPYLHCSRCSALHRYVSIRDYSVIIILSAL
jgi:hypothetical protein